MVPTDDGGPPRSPEAASPNPHRRELLASMGLSLVAAAVGATPTPARAVGFPVRVQRELTMNMAKQYALNGDKAHFKELWEIQSAFRGLGAWPSTPTIVNDAFAALSRVMDGESLDRDGFRHVVRIPQGKLVVFSDHHILPDGNRQSLVWRTNRAGYASILRHYGEDGWVVAENGDVEDLVVIEPAETVATYAEVLRKRTGQGRVTSRGANRLQEWFRADALGLVQALRAARAPRRTAQLRAILDAAGNKPYYDALAELAASKQLVRVAGNHDYQLREYGIGAEHLVPADVLIFGKGVPYVVMHGHQFDEATNPGVAALYGEIISECLGIWFQGPDRIWSQDQIGRILDGGFPNRLATHSGAESGPQGVTGSFAAALLSGQFKNDEEWAHAWEKLFGHPIAWEYGAEDWAASVRGAFARPGRLVDDAMNGKQFFKFRHLDEAEIVGAMARWGVDAGLVLGHSHEVRSVRAGKIGRYYNSGAAGRFAGLIWALELTRDTAEVVAWHVEPDGGCRKYRFDKKDASMFSYFEARRTEERVA